jgi:hypothetical protein
VTAIRETRPQPRAQATAIQEPRTKRGTSRRLAAPARAAAPVAASVGLRYAVACLAIGLAAQLGLWLHVRAAGAEPYPTMVRGLDQLPLDLQLPPSPRSRFLWMRTLQAHGFQVAAAPRWHGTDTDARELQALRETLSQAQLVPDQLLVRSYTTAQSPYPVALYMIHSRTGEDRKHHPEVCIRDVAGAPEDLKARATVYLDAGRKRPAQRFRFRTGTESYRTVYYWHYTFKAPEREGMTLLQQIHQQQSRLAPSVTVQVSTLAPPEALPLIERSFLPALDAALERAHLPPKSQVGCNRMAISIIRQ